MYGQIFLWFSFVSVVVELGFSYGSACLAYVVLFQRWFSFGSACCCMISSFSFGSALVQLCGSVLCGMVQMWFSCVWHGSDVVQLCGSVV